MKNSKKFLLLFAAAFISVVVTAQAADEKTDYKTFNDCWGSGDFTKSCSYDGATVRGCQPDPGSACVGVR